MPNRFQIQTYDWVYRFLTLKYGEKCLICEQAPPKIKLEVDHADGNCLNNDPENLHLLCHKCNLELRNWPAKDHLELIKMYSAKNERVSERVENINHNGNQENGKNNHHNGNGHNIQGNTALNKYLLDYNTGSLEMKANSIFETNFRVWIISVIKEKGSYPKKQAVNAGAEFIGCNIQTIGRYLDKLTSDTGILTESSDSLHRTVIKLKEA